MRFNDKYNHAGVQELAILLRILEVLFSNLSQKTVYLPTPLELPQ
jgi:hypothetical protein